MRLIVQTHTLCNAFVSVSFRFNIIDSLFSFLHVTKHSNAGLCQQKYDSNIVNSRHLMFHLQALCTANRRFWFNFFLFTLQFSFIPKRFGLIRQKIKQRNKGSVFLCFCRMQPIIFVLIINQRFILILFFHF